MTSLRHELGRPVTAHEVQDALVIGFEQAMNICLATDTLSAQEQAETRRIVEEKYGADDWTTKT